VKELERGAKGEKEVLAVRCRKGGQTRKQDSCGRERMGNAEQYGSGRGRGRLE